MTIFIFILSREANGGFVVLAGRLKYEDIYVVPVLILFLCLLYSMLLSVC